MESKENVHLLSFTSRVENPTHEQLPPSDINFPFHRTGCIKDIRFLKDCQPSILQATAQKGSQGDFKDIIKIEDVVDDHDQFLDAVMDPSAHNELVKLSVDATRLPKGTQKIHVIAAYTIPGQFERMAAFWLPVENPVVPDETTVTTSLEPETPTKKPETPPKQPDQPDQPDPKDQPESGGFFGPAFWIILLIILVALAFGGFLYRRRLVIQHRELA